MSSSTVRFVSITALALAGTITAAHAQGYGSKAGYVVAESRFGHGTVSGPVRATSRGPQVRLPGGSWIYCRASCRETLREETVDFWEAHEPGGAPAARFGILDYYWRR